MRKHQRAIVKEFSSVETPEGPIDFLLIRSKRRTMTITIDEKAQIKVSVPFHLPTPRINQFIKEKAAWILRKVEEIKKRLADLEQKAFVHNQEFLFLGRKYKLDIIEDHVSPSTIHFNGQTWLIKIASSLNTHQKEVVIKKKLMNWYRNQAKEILGGRLLHFARLMQVEPQKISIRTQRRIWGSCHPHKQAIYLNWQIVMAPLEVIDYVIVHELAHLTHANHSKRFWQRVQKFMPDFKTRKKWFKQNALDMALPL